MQFVKNIMRVVFTSFFNYGSSFIVGLILPMILSVEDYGRYREYILYLSFAYVLNLGFNDGIYIKYGGKTFSKVDKSILHDEHAFVFKYQIMINSMLMLIALILSNTLLFWFSVSSFFILLNTYHQNLRKSMGEFKVYSYSQIFTSTIYVLLLLVAIFVMKIDNYIIYIILTLISYIILFIFFEIYFYIDFGKGLRSRKENKFPVFKTGIFILIGNMSIAFVGNLGNWITNVFFDLESFAQFSFQNSLINITLMIVNAVSLVFYSLISRNKNHFLYNNIKTFCFIIGIVSGIGYFLISYFVEMILPNYIPSLKILSITLMAMPFIIISNILIGNLYKVSRSERKYFVSSMIFALVSTIIVLFSYYIFNSLSGIAYGTLTSYILWVFYNLFFEFSYLKPKIKDIIVLSSYFLVFTLLVQCQNNILSFLLYLLYIVLVLTFYSRDIRKFLVYMKNR